MSIKVKWSEQFCSIVQITNLTGMENRRVGIDDRLVTWEGPEHLVTE